MLLTVKEAAAVLRVAPARVYELLREGVVPSVRIGRQVRVDEAKLRAWIDGGGKPLIGGWRRDG